MTTRLTRSAGAVMLAGLVGFPAIGTGAQKKITVTSCTPPSELVMVGTRVTLRPSAKDLKRIKSESGGVDMPIYLQWRKNGDVMPGATNRTLLLEAVTLEDAATYALSYDGPAEGEVGPMHLSVMSTNPIGNSGTVSTPIGDFTTANNTICGDTFNRFKVYRPFCGPGLTSCSTYPNTPPKPKLKIDTCSTANGPTLDTGVQIKEEVFGFPQMCCNDDFACGLSNPKLSSCTANLSSNNTYRVGIFFKNSTLGGITTVRFNWTYLD
jgi:hypothetical protein